MGTFGLILFIVSGALFVFSVWRQKVIADFKIAYYETKLKNRDVDISSVENITLREILKS